MTNNDKALSACDVIEHILSKTSDDKECLVANIQTIRAALTPQSSADLRRVREALSRARSDMSWLIDRQHAVRTDTKDRADYWAGQFKIAVSSVKMADEKLTAVLSEIDNMMKAGIR